MKQRIGSVLLLLVLVVGLVGCSFSFSEGDASLSSTGAVVTLKFGNGTEDRTVRLSPGDRMPTPAAPEKDGWLFRGWYTDDACTKPYDFSLAVRGSLTLYAGYLPDYEKWTNRLTETVIPSLVLVRTKTLAGGVAGVKTGSGIVIRTEEDSQGAIYYILTNNHVVSDAAPYALSPFQVEDYRGDDTYQKISLVARSEEYDLAVLQVRGASAAKYTLPGIRFASANAATGEAIAALGQPGGQRNALTFGHALEYRLPQASANGTGEVAVTFPVLYHSAPITNGSSGGAVVNFAGELAAVNFAGMFSEDGTFRAGISVPIERVLIFLRAIPALSGKF